MTEHATTRVQALECDVDGRLADIWAIVFQTEVMEPVLEHELGRVSFGAFLRAAYSVGYQDALREDEAGRRGALARAHGYAHP